MHTIRLSLQKFLHKSLTSLRYEERIVELHSVIAELSRKLEDERDDVIREESEYEAGEEEEHDNSRSAKDLFKSISKSVIE